uniref:Uncharacterized protein n=1 Tax=Arundo donax TaxID=35708 RepID=A0A0A9B450_ARUDO
MHNQNIHVKDHEKSKTPRLSLVSKLEKRLKFKSI